MKGFLAILSFFVLALEAIGGEIKVGLLPILETLPVHVALQEGYFPEDVKVELVPVASAAERDQLVASGEIDLAINDLISVAFFNHKGVKMVVVRTARQATKSYPQFLLLSAPTSGIRNPKELKGVPIAISEATIIHYVTERLLQRAGLGPEDMTFLAIPRIPDRMSALVSGRVKAATLPDPLSLLALQQGANPVMDDSSFPEYSLSVYSVRADFLEGNPHLIKGFLEGIERAVRAINSDKERWRKLLVERKLVPPPLKGSYSIPDLPLASVPTEGQWSDVIDWMLQKGLINQAIPYGECINSGLLP
ncbi:MAG: hypothetical protein DRG32_00080 [Deltaproteobacteria bacterium]|nr:MAG: hypothetical protein DRG32_00080 [Deltaproteobacteria bacterium]